MTAGALAIVRSRGEVRLGFRVTDGRTMLGEGFQEGCLKLRIPRAAKADIPCAVLLNTSGGLAGGDRLHHQIEWGTGSAMTVTSLAAEKIYRTPDAAASVTTRLTVRPGAVAEWLPQETILFDRAKLTRDTQVRLAGDATFLGVEAMVLGRTAMDEAVRSGALLDRWRIWREERLVYADALRLEGAIDDQMQRPAIGAGARAIAFVIHASPRAAALLRPVREALTGALGLAAATSWNGLLVVRLLARDGAVLRHDLLRALAPLRDHRAMPRVWSL